jgi:hypothetical protein
LKHLVFEGADEGLGPGVVIWVGARGHALAQAGFGKGLAEGGAGILAAAVAVEDGGVVGVVFPRKNGQVPRSGMVVSLGMGLGFGSIG